jgi:hypothetical protein
VLLAICLLIAREVTKAVVLFEKCLTVRFGVRPIAPAEQVAGIGEIQQAES